MLSKFFPFFLFLINLYSWWVEHAQYMYDARTDPDMRAHLVGIKLLVSKYSLFITHLDQVICCLNIRSLFSMKGI